MKVVLRIYSIASVAAVALFSAGTTYARELCPPGPFAGLCKIKIDQQGSGLIGAIISVLLIIAVVTCLIFMIFGAIKYVTAAGDQGKTAQARSHIIAAIVGLIIALCAFFIVNVVSYVITGNTNMNFAIPKL